MAFKCDPAESETIGKYEEVETRIIKDIEFKVPFRCLGVKMDPQKTMKILSMIPYRAERLLTIREIKSLYE